jgi:hypothetical protein
MWSNFRNNLKNDQDSKKSKNNGKFFWKFLKTSPDLEFPYLVLQENLVKLTANKVIELAKVWAV